MKNISTSSAAFQQTSRALVPARRFACAAALACAALVAVPAHAAPIDSLIKSVKFDDVDGVNKLLGKGMDPNSVDSQGIPLLVIAAREKSDKVTAALLANPKTDIEIQDKAGENALMMASLAGDLNIVNLLIAKDAEVNKKGWAPLHYAAANGHDDIVKVLLDHSAYVDAGSPNGTTPLMMAARGGHVSTVKLLLDNGADLSVKNQIGMTALDFAKTYKEPDVVEGLTARMQQMPQK
ncbi:ankyrin repeat domain-containing protein [Paraburkholderia antibiotica]|uniref:Ankyrin repeat domain-containing protein n=1 Tax=Paraburkholderia antibiotica TaxID=2728839 RepID=A0A7X9X4I1_9BURK|nr:ankyrin repeat domain-containing protein [Paraburkholderia antibiotica]NML31261.1 ankyrin repeat domain-containing protein [Paraburkholderia antibiotica]